jgi:GR25 family glycosyltransferase involved in LPS biosynthesis
MHAYVINLGDRSDRWDSVLAQSSKLQLPIVRIDAVEMKTLASQELYVAAGVAATWQSHQLAMSIFLESGEEYGVILEDDFLVTKYWSADSLELALKAYPDFFQLGFLITSPVDRIKFFLNNTFDLTLKILNWICSCSKLVRNQLGSRLLIREQAGLPWCVIPNDIRAGGQAYLVSRKFALASRFMNSPCFTSTDGVFISLGDVRSFRMFRFRKSLINQTNSVTSVQQRYL